MITILRQQVRLEVPTQLGLIGKLMMTPVI